MAKIRMNDASFATGERNALRKQQQLESLDSQKAEIVEHLQAGTAVRALAKELGCDTTIFQRWVDMHVMDDAS